MKSETVEKKCRNPKCKRIIVGDSKLGLCSTCFNKYGSTGTLLGTTVIGTTIWKNKRKIANGVINVFKHIKP